MRNPSTSYRTIKKFLRSTTFLTIGVPVLGLIIYATASVLRDQVFKLPPSVIFNPSCYQRKLIEAARTNKATLSSNPRAVTAWIDFGNNRSIKLPVVSTILRTEACR